MREKFKALKDKVREEACVDWYTGDDVPTTWSKKKLRKLKKKTIRTNYKLGSIDKGTFKRLLALL
jgi:hypothetical protein